MEIVFEKLFCTAIVRKRWKKRIDQCQWFYKKEERWASIQKIKIKIKSCSRLCVNLFYYIMYFFSGHLEFSWNVLAQCANKNYKLSNFFLNIKCEWVCVCFNWSCYSRSSICLAQLVQSNFNIQSVGIAQTQKHKHT